MNINDYRPYLRDTTFHHLTNCLLRLENKEFFSCAIWGVVFIEAFLNQLSDAFDLSKRKAYDLNCTIQRLTQYNKNNSKKDFLIPDEVIKRCSDIRNTWNRLVHHTELPKMTLVEDSKFIVASIEALVL